MMAWNVDRLALALATAVLGSTACSSHSSGRDAAPAPVASADTAGASTGAAAGADTTAAAAAGSTATDTASRDSAVRPSAPGDTAAEAPSEMNPNPGSEMNPNPGGDSSASHSSATAGSPGSNGASSGGSAGASDSGYVTYDAASKTVTFRLVAGPFTFDGFSNGGGTLTVPPGTNNVWNFEQADGTPHSAEIDSAGGPLPNSGGNPAVPRAYTNKVVEGLPQGATDVIKFTAPAQGTYRIICGVPGHAVGGMWIWFKIDPAAKTPTLAATPK